MIVNSHNEWDQLEEVIVGDGFPTSIPALDFSFKLFFNDNILGKKIDVTQYINIKGMLKNILKILKNMLNYLSR